jgi:hypothetical protein
MSPGVTDLVLLVIIPGHLRLRTGHQPQPGHEALVGEDIEGTAFRCVEL